MIVLDTHIWFWWVSGEHSRLSHPLLEALASEPRVGVSAVLASVDSAFGAYDELAGRVLT